MTRRARFWFWGGLLAPLLLALAVVLSYLTLQQGGLAPFRVPRDEARTPIADAAAIERGRYLATLGNCAGCHTAPRGTPYAGGRAFVTAYGTVYSSNLTPDAQHGIGAWSLAEFRHAMRHGVSRNGVLSPVFPYASFRHLADDDLRDLFTYLATLAPSDAPRRESALEFPANLPGAMALWRLLYYRPLQNVAVPSDAVAARGAYLVQGIGHCATCHGARGTFASQGAGAELWGARSTEWYAPPLHQAALSRFAPDTLADYLRGGAASGRTAYGRMADVIAANLQHLTPDDALAMERYLRQLPAPRAQASTPLRSASASRNGHALYTKHCADCHGERGEGEAGKYPSLAASSAVTAPDPVNLVRLIQFGAVAPSTPLAPQPYTMPPFAGVLTAEEIAAIANALREDAGVAAMPVTANEVQNTGIGH